MLAAARTGAPWAFERLYREMSAPVAGYLRLQGATDPEDLTSEVFMGVFAGLGRFEGDEAGFRSWVLTIAHRRLVDERRRAPRRPEPVPDPPDAVGGHVEDDALGALGDQWVREVCDRLPPDQRTVVLLRVVGDLSIDQVAEIIGRSPGAVKQLQRRGLEAVRRTVEREGVTR